jgi:hypothetical protein
MGYSPRGSPLALGRKRHIAMVAHIQFVRVAPKADRKKASIESVMDTAVVEKRADALPPLETVEADPHAGSR